MTIVITAFDIGIAIPQGFAGAAACRPMPIAGSVRTARKGSGGLQITTGNM